MACARTSARGSSSTRASRTVESGVGGGDASDGATRGGATAGNGVHDERGVRWRSVTTTTTRIRDDDDDERTDGDDVCGAWWWARYDGERCGFGAAKRDVDESGVFGAVERRRSRTNVI